MKRRIVCFYSERNISTSSGAFPSYTYSCDEKEKHVQFQKLTSLTTSQNAGRVVKVRRIFRTASGGTRMKFTIRDGGCLSLIHFIIEEVGLHRPPADGGFLLLINTTIHTQTHTHTKNNNIAKRSSYGIR